MLIRALFIRREIEREISLFDLFLFFPHFFSIPFATTKEKISSHSGEIHRGWLDNFASWN